MSYTVYVGRIEHVRKHPKADRLQIGIVLGNLIITDSTAKEGDLGLFFPPDGQISHEFLRDHDLYERKDESGQKAGGYFGSNGKVRGIILRDVRTDGFWMKLDKLKPRWFTDEIVEGKEFSDELLSKYSCLAGKPLARKFFSQKSAAQVDKSKTKPKTKKAPKEKLIGMELHYDTPRFQEQIEQFKKTYNHPCRVIITEKVHGTSQRTGIAKVYRPPRTWWERLKNRFGFYDGYSWKFKVGTRTVNLQDEKGGFFYGSNEFRFKAVEALRAKLRDGECVYHEVVGYQGAKPIQPPHNLEKADKSFKGSLNHYTYGCEPQDAKIYVYRITQMLADGSIKELNWQDVESRCHELGIETVPVLRNVDWGIPDYDPFEDELKWHEEPGRGLSPTFESLVEGGPQIAEGVCIRVEQAGMPPIVLKLKNVSFGLMEGYIKEQQDFVDIEEEEQMQGESDERV